MDRSVIEMDHSIIKIDVTSDQNEPYSPIKLGLYYNIL